jgi:hypothetical protein
VERICPNCGSGNALSYKFCNKCGHDLKKPKEAPPKELKEPSFDEKLTKIQRYIPKGLTEKILSQRDRIEGERKHVTVGLTEKILSQRDRIEGERKHVTVMFCDMEGFTQLSEDLGPEEAYTLMDQVYEILIHKVHDSEGTVNEISAG